MGRIAKSFRAVKMPSFAPGYPAQYWLDWLGAGKSATGLDINELSALQVAAVYACVKVISETIASLPLFVYQRLALGGKDRAPEHTLYRILHDQANPEMTSFEWRETFMGHLLLWGNAYSEIERDGAGRPIALWPLRPDRMMIKRPAPGAPLVYLYQLMRGDLIELAPDQVLHVRLMSIDGIKGLGPIAQMREAIGLTMALEQFAARLFGNGAAPRGFLSHPKALSDRAKQNLRESWEQMHKGLDNAHRMAVLEEGVTWQKVGIDPEDAQFLLSRQYQTVDIARIFRIQPHKIQDLSRGTFSNIEQQGLEFVTDTIRPHCVRLEQAYQQRLFLPMDYGRFFAEFNLDGLMRGDAAARAAYYQVMRYLGAMNADEIREKENLNPIGGKIGQEYWTPANMMPSANAPDSPDAQPDSPDQNRRLPLPDASGALTRTLLEDRVRKVVKREKVDVVRAARKALEYYRGKEERADFADWLRGFFLEHQRYIQGELRVLEPYSRPGYVAQYAQRHSEESLTASLRALEADDPVDALEDLFNEFELSRPAAVVQREFVNLRDSGQPGFNLTLNIPERMVEVPVTIQPQQAPVVNLSVEAPPAPDVHVDAPIQVPIEVQPPQVVNNIAPAAVTVQPPAVQVNVEGNASKGVKVVYDRNGRVIGTEPNE